MYSSDIIIVLSNESFVHISKNVIDLQTKIILPSYGKHLKQNENPEILDSSGFIVNFLKFLSFFRKRQLYLCFFRDITSINVKK